MRKRTFLGFALVLLALILCTRLPILTHEMVNHPDEHVFVQGSTSLRDVLLEGAEYTETKPYPEGSYFFYLPFQLLAWLVGKITGLEQNARIWNRAASVLYFTMGGVFSLALIRRYFGGKRAMALYVPLLVFSLLHIEQSRYGTGDSISFALLMLMIFCCALWAEGGKNLWLYAAAVLVGFLGSVKYPLFYFCFVPLGAVFVCKRGAQDRAKLVAMGILLALVGFLALSPEVIKDPRYIIEVCRKEVKAYMLSGNRTEVGGPVNHIFALVTYWLGYSDVLLAPVLAVLGLRALCKGSEKKPVHTLMYIVLPVAAAGFALYNMFVTALFMRTLYPFFCIALLYAVCGLAKLSQSKKALAGVLVGLTVVRGVVFLGAYMPENAAEKMDGYILQAQEISGGQRMLGLSTNRYMTGHWTNFRDKYPQVELVDLTELQAGNWPELQSGDVVVVGPLEMARAKGYVFPIDDEEIQTCIDGWKQFKQENAQYYVGQSYPQWYGALFGFWINGVVSEFDFPMNFVYAVP